MLPCNIMSEKLRFICTNVYKSVFCLILQIYHVDARGICSFLRFREKNILVLFVFIFLADDLSVWVYLSALLYQCRSHMYTPTASSILLWHN